MKNGNFSAFTQGGLLLLLDAAMKNGINNKTTQQATCCIAPCFLNVDAIDK